MHVQTQLKHYARRQHPRVLPRQGSRNAAVRKQQVTVCSCLSDSIQRGAGLGAGWAATNCVPAACPAPDDAETSDSNGQHSQQDRA